MPRKRLLSLVAALALGGLSLASRVALCQDLVRSVVVSVDSAGRVMPQQPGSGAVAAKRYWADATTSSIRRANLDGTAIEEIASGLHVPYGLGFDPATGMFLWTSSEDEVVQTLPAGGGQILALQTEFEEPYALIVQGEGVETGYAVLDGAVVKITRPGESESEETEILLPFDAVTQPVHGLALDATTGVLYLGDPNGQMSRRIRLADGTLQTLTFVDETFPSEPLPIKVTK